MINKRIILLPLLLSIFMIGAVSATTTNTTDKLGSKLTDKEIVKKDNPAKKDIFSKNKKDKLGITYTGTFDDLSTEITNTKTSGTLNLQQNYQYTNGSPEGITITKPITINGNGHTINGNKQSRIFKVKGVPLILKNLNINNGKTDTDGGAVYTRSNIIIINCTFTNNNARDEGGAIHTFGGKVTATNCKFTNNKAGDNGGAINAAGEVTANNCVFTNNNKDGDNSGAINAFKVTATNCKFTNNNARYSGGAISASNYITANNCTFNKNSAENGGAIYTGTKVTINNCVFNENSAGIGGAIYIDANNSDIKINNARFVNNKAKKNSASGGIYIGEYISDLLVKKTTFKGDSIYCEFLCNLNLINAQVKVQNGCINVTPNPIEFGSNTAIIFKSNKKYNVEIYIDGKETIYKNTNSINKIIKDLQIGKHTIDIKIFTKYQGEKYYDYSKTFKIKVTKSNPKIIAKPQTYKAKIKNKKYTITLKTNKNTLKNAKLTLNIDKKTYPAKTNNKGQATFTIKNLNKKGKYIATINYKGDKNYNKTTKKVKITIK